VGWIVSSFSIVFLESWITFSVLVALLAACFTMMAGTSAWEYYENRVWGVGPVASQRGVFATQAEGAFSRAHAGPLTKEIMKILETIVFGTK
jgi:hypothetical protein